MNSFGVDWHLLGTVVCVPLVCTTKLSLGRHRGSVLLWYGNSWGIVQNISNKLFLIWHQHISRSEKFWFRSRNIYMEISFENWQFPKIWSQYTSFSTKRRPEIPIRSQSQLQHPPWAPDGSLTKLISTTYSKQLFEDRVMRWYSI